MNHRSDVLESALATAKVDDEFVCTRRSFIRMRDRMAKFQQNMPSHVFRHRRDGNIVVIWRSR